MITTAILNFLIDILFLLALPVRALSDATLPDGLTNAIDQAGRYLSMVNMIIPVNTLIIVIGSVLAIDTLIFSYKAIMWVIRKIPGIG